MTRKRLRDSWARASKSFDAVREIAGAWAVGSDVDKREPVDFPEELTVLSLSRPAVAENRHPMSRVSSITLRVRTALRLGSVRGDGDSADAATECCS